MGVPQTEPWSHWPGGDFWTIGILGWTTDELGSRFGMHFLDGADDIGPYQLAVVDAGRIGQLWLMDHKYSPQAGTEVRVDIRVVRDDALTALWQITGLDIRAFKWVNPYPAHPWSHRLPHAFGLSELDLTARESQILELLGAGADPTSIAANLGLALPTVRAYLAKLRTKFRATDNVQLKNIIRDSRPVIPFARMRPSA